MKSYLKKISSLLYKNINKLKTDIKENLRNDVKIDLETYIFDYTCENKNFIEEVLKNNENNEKIK